MNGWGWFGMAMMVIVTVAIVGLGHLGDRASARRSAATAKRSRTTRRAARARRNRPAGVSRAARGIERASCQTARPQPLGSTPRDAFPRGSTVVRKGPREPRSIGHAWRRAPGTGRPRPRTRQCFLNWSGAARRDSCSSRARAGSARRRSPLRARWHSPIAEGAYWWSALTLPPTSTTCSLRRSGRSRRRAGR